MCGIFALIDPSQKFLDNDYIKSQFMKGQHRGPEFSIMKKFDFLTMGFHRLAINGLNKGADQPIEFNNIVLICNGEIYNYKSLYKLLNIKPSTDSDCEVIIHLYLKFGLDHMLQLLDGVFSFCLLDKRNNTISFARDPFGIRPLYYGLLNDVFIYASELKMIEGFYNSIDCNSNKFIHSFPPGSYTYYNFEGKQLMESNVMKYYNFPFSSSISNDSINETSLSRIEIEQYKNIFLKVKKDFLNAVHKRVESSDRPIACLLSGGLDSSLVSSIVNKYLIDSGRPPVETFSIGLKGSVDLHYAKLAADYIGSKHTQIEITEKDFFDAIPEVIKAIESYDTTTIRASVGNYLVSKYIKEHSDAKVIFNGDGADELMGGYLYFHKCPDDLEFDFECKRLLRNIHYFDVLRSDKTISAHGLEARTPFLDRTFVQNYLSIHPSIRNHNNKLMPLEKWIIRQAFLYDENEKLYLPEEILTRRKEAFSDGVSSQTKPWFQIIQENIPEKYHNVPSEKYMINPPTTPEQYYYRSIFEETYPNCSHVIPYFWMPRFIESTDSSARTLSIYKDLN